MIIKTAGRIHLSREETLQHMIFLRHLKAVYFEGKSTITAWSLKYNWNLWHFLGSSDLSHLGKGERQEMVFKKSHSSTRARMQN